jgi:deoxyribodipyrimidine photo-lyase
MPVLVWFRRDLRLDDQPALMAAADAGPPVVCAFVLDPAVYRGTDRSPPRIRFLLAGLRDLDERLRAAGGGLIVRRGDGADQIVLLAAELGADVVHACADDEPFARARDERAARLLAAAGRRLVLHHDATVVPHELVRSAAGTPYATYAAYARAVDRIVADEPLVGASPPLCGRLAPVDEAAAVPDARELGVTGPEPGLQGGETAGLARLRAWRGGGLRAYAERRDDLADDGATSRLSPYLKLGMVSPRRALAVARSAGAARWRAELLWRDWFKYVLHHHPDLAERPVDRRFERLEWTGGDAELAAWARGETGYGLVDAGMRQLVATGFQPNRVRMVCASFLVKDLHVDWRRGERFYRDHLVDGDLSSNAGNWQWVAGTGLDAAPYFRVFNPLLQESRYDPAGEYVRRWAPDRPAPIVDHAREREAALAAYRRAAGQPVTEG